MALQSNQPETPEALDEAAVEGLLREVAAGRIEPEAAKRRLLGLCTESLGFATLDHQRALRKGFAEVIFCQGKTAEQVGDIFARLSKRNPRVLATRATTDQYEVVRAKVPAAEFDETARVIWLDRGRRRAALGGIAVVCAGTADLPVAAEAARTLRIMGHEPDCIHDVGVAGLHRLNGVLPRLAAANVVIVIAGMEGALPSVIGGLVAAPVIAVPTSVGYGASFQGLAALLGMLNSCAPGVSVVNIDNGFGAAFQAATINRRTQDAGGETPSRAENPDMETAP